MLKTIRHDFQEVIILASKHPNECDQTAVKEWADALKIKLPE